MPEHPCPKKWADFLEKVDAGAYAMSTSEPWTRKPPNDRLLHSMAWTLTPEQVAELPAALAEYEAWKLSKAEAQKKWEAAYDKKEKKFKIDMFDACDIPQDDPFCLEIYRRITRHARCGLSEIAEQFVGYVEEYYNLVCEHYIRKGS